MSNKHISFIRDHVSSSEVLCQLAEECSELAHAALKLRRTYDNGNPTPVTSKEAFERVEEEVADVNLCLRVLGFGLGLDYYEDMMDFKSARWVNRLKQKERDPDGK